MKIMIARTFTAGLAVAALAFSLPGVSSSPVSTDSSKAQPVVVELFTSEGCSTCPPADALLLKLAATQPVEGANIIVLEEHVDYWNHQGWTDPYSSSDWTLRQQDYVARFKEKEPYTPQMIIDGQAQMVGGQEELAQQAIRQAASQPKTEITLTAENSGKDGAEQFQYKVRVVKLVGNTERDTAEVWLAVSESGLGSSVDGGENAGKLLHHAPVLRSLHKIGVASPKGETAFETSARVKFTRDWKRQNLQVAVFVQEKKSMRILGAASAVIPN
jgi:hypothetical protein